MSDKVVKRKPRLTFVCENCKKRRVKCDKGTPCSTCIKLKSECVYDTSYLDQPSYVSSAKRPIALNIKPDSSSRARTHKPVEQEKVTIDRNELEFLKNKLSVLQSLSSTSNARHYPSNYPSISGINDIRKYNVHFSDSPVLKTTAPNIPAQPSPTGLSNPLRLPPMRLPMLEDANASSFLGKNPYASDKDVMNMIDMDSEAFSVITLVRSFKGLRLLYSENSSLDLDVSTARRNVIEGAANKIHHNLSHVKTQPTHPDVDLKMEELLEHHLDQFSLAELAILGLDQKILSILPTRKHFWILIDRFFQLVYPFYPFVDRDMFYEDLFKLFGFPSDENEPILSFIITEKSDYISIALALIILRFGYATLFVANKEVNSSYVNFDPAQNPQMDQQKVEETLLVRELMITPVALKNIELATNILSMFPYNMKTQNFKLFVTLNLLRIYYRYCAEDLGEGDGYKNAGFIQSLVLKMCYSFGFHHALNSFESSKYTRRSFVIGKRIYFFAIFQDIFHVALKGSPMEIAPTVEFEPMRLEDILLEEETSQSVLVHLLKLYVTLWNGLIPSITSVLRVYNSSPSAVPMKEFTGGLSVFEIVCTQQFDDMYKKIAETAKSDHLSPTNNYHSYLIQRNFVTKILTGFSSFYISMCCHMIKHYLPLSNDELVYFYLQKVFAKIYQVLKILPDVTLNAKYLMDLLLVSVLQLFLFKSLLYMFHFIIKFKFTLHNCVTSDKYTAMMEKFCGLLVKHAKCIIHCLYSFVPRFFYSWKIFKCTKFYLNAILDRDFYRRHERFTEDIVHPMFSEQELLGVTKIADIEFFETTLDNMDSADKKLGTFPGEEIYDRRWLEFYYKTSGTDVEFDLFKEV